MAHIHLIGLGRMGTPVCGRLTGAGHEVTVSDQNAERDAVARSCGAKWTGTAAAGAAGAEVLLTVLPGPAEVDSAVDDVVLAVLAPGAVWIDLSSNTAEGAEPVRRRARAHGVGVLEAPMGGGPEDAGQGRLRLYVGGEADLLRHHRPLLEHLAPPENIVHTGGHGTGYTVKLLVNLLWFGQAAATAEALLLGRRAGVDLPTLQRAFAGSAAGSDFIRRDLAGLFAGDYLTSYGIDRVHQQLAAVTSMAAALGTPHDLTESVRRLYQETVERFGSADGELLAVALLEERAGFRLRDDPAR
ncbi:NAD(P)-dependent oxidoreductase [Actinacidiphila acidipaludis]|uniref:NAD(P)-dependent oxidoreductase n=1 Tax=Actinacidiphila acidipaludis TaxID=2873382 RepID=A0ABS7QF23_9ACTN|nr:NAD(P)-dependent oxidoreductase [Streptomyces acidipaludis]MBY8881040.1 NAD(P)-dependent oxidoreductase [Streptomyces acidipaludis]